MGHSFRGVVFVTGAIFIASCGAYSGTSTDNQAGVSDMLDGPEATDGGSGAIAKEASADSKPSSTPDAGATFDAICTAPPTHFQMSFDGLTVMPPPQWDTVMGLSLGLDTGVFGAAAPSLKVSSATSATSAHGYIERTAMFTQSVTAAQARYSFKVAEPMQVSHVEIGCTLSLQSPKAVVAIAIDNGVFALVSSQNTVLNPTSAFSPQLVARDQWMQATVTVVPQAGALAVTATLAQIGTNAPPSIATATVKNATATGVMFQCGSTTLDSTSFADLYVDDIDVTACP